VSLIKNSFRMKIDSTSNIELEKQSFLNSSFSGELSFGKWLCLELFTNTLNSKIKEGQKPK